MSEHGLDDLVVNASGSAYIRRNPEITREKMLKMELEDFLSIVTGKNKEERRKLVGGKSPIRGFLVFKLKLRARGCRLPSSKRVALMEKLAIEMWNEMQADADTFFAGFQFGDIKIKKEKAEKLRNNKSEDGKVLERYDESKAKLLKFPHFALSFHELVKFSITSFDITHILGVPSWKIVALHILGDAFWGRNRIYLDDLASKDFFFSRSLAVIILSKKKTNLLLNDKQKALMISLLRGEKEFERSAEAIFAKELSKFLTPKMLNRIELNCEMLSMLVDNVSKEELRYGGKADKKSIILKLVSPQEVRYSGREFICCPLRARCLKVAERFSKGKSLHLNCSDCPMCKKNGWRQQKQTNDMAFRSSSLYNHYS